MNKFVACLFLIIVSAFYSCTKKYDAHVYYENTDDETECIFNDVPGYISVGSVRELYDSSSVLMTNNRILKGIVISDFSTNNFDAKSMDVQDSTGGIIVVLQDNHTIPLGTLVSINISNKWLSEGSGLLQITDVPGSNVNVSDSCVQVPFITTIASIKNNPDLYESRFVRINEAKLNGIGSTYNGYLNLLQSNDTLLVYTSSNASFQADTYPTQDLLFARGIISKLNGTPVLLLRNLKDVQKKN